MLIWTQQLVHHRIHSDSSALPNWSELQFHSIVGGTSAASCRASSSWSRTSCRSALVLSIAFSIIQLYSANSFRLSKKNPEDFQHHFQSHSQYTASLEFYPHYSLRNAFPWGPELQPEVIQQFLNLQTTVAPTNGRQYYLKHPETLITNKPRSQWIWPTQRTYENMKVVSQNLSNWRQHVCVCGSSVSAKSLFLPRRSQCRHCRLCRSDRTSPGWQSQSDVEVSWTHKQHQSPTFMQHSLSFSLSPSLCAISLLPSVIYLVLSGSPLGYQSQ